ncbi:MAG: NUDIX domain-containing protein [Defluviitaleaceae bacterium]|nr:NUDIX domain-containing protein [Defluviitaleaceae bacterium]
MIFNEVYYRTDKSEINLQNGTEIFRRAARAVIMDGDKILMAHLGKTDEYKFPGGGVAENESAETALKREVLEEVGYNILEIGEKIGEITEYDTAQEGEQFYFKMVSEYYAATVESRQLSQHLEEYEQALQFTPCWVDIETAYRTNSQNKGKFDKTLGIARETIALGKILDSKQIY